MTNTNILKEVDYFKRGQEISEMLSVDEKDVQLYISSAFSESVYVSGVKINYIKILFMENKTFISHPDSIGVLSE